MRNLIYLNILLATILLVVSCQLPSDSISSVSPANQDNDNKIVNSKISSEVKSAIQENLVDLSLKSDYEVKRGILHFKDLDTYLKVRNSLRKLSISDRIQKTNLSGFTSLLSLYQEYIDKFEKDQDIESYRDIIGKVSNDKKQQFLNSDFVVSALVNRAGLVYIGKILYQFSDKQQEIIIDGDISKLGITSQMVQRFDNPTTQVAKQARLASADLCGSSWRNKYSDDDERQIALDGNVQ